MKQITATILETKSLVLIKGGTTKEKNTTESKTDKAVAALDANPYG